MLNGAGLRIGRSAIIHFGAPRQEPLSKKIHINVLREVQRTSVCTVTIEGCVAVKRFRLQRRSWPPETEQRLLPALAFCDDSIVAELPGERTRLDLLWRQIRPPFEARFQAATPSRKA